MKKLTEKQIARTIERRVSYFSGWSVSREKMQQDCIEAARAILKALAKRGPSRGSGAAR